MIFNVLDIYWFLATDGIKKLETDAVKRNIELGVFILKDEYSQINSISLEGVSLEYSTLWKLYGVIENGILKLYKDKDKEFQVAESDNSGVISEVNYSGISGNVSLDYKCKDDSIVILKLEKDLGQFRRYLLALTTELQDNVKEISSLYDLYNVRKVKDIFIEYIFKMLSFPYSTNWSKKFKKYLISELFFIYKYKGTEGVFKFILYKFFGWKLIHIESLNKSAFFVNSIDSVTYDGVSNEFNDYRLYYDPEKHTPIDKAKIMIKYFNDSNFEEKRISLENFMRYFLPASIKIEYEYIP